MQLNKINATSSTGKVDSIVSEAPRLNMLGFARVSVFLALTAIFYLVSAGSRDVREAEEIPEIVSEDSCLSAGGICVHVSKCASDKISTQAECAQQKSLGAVCCHSAFPPEETRCELLAGECKTECAENLKVTQAVNCAEGEVCCTLV